MDAQSVAFSRRSLLLSLAAIPVATACERVVRPPAYGYVMEMEKEYRRETQGEKVEATVAECDWSLAPMHYVELTNWYLGTLLGRRKDQVSSVHAPGTRPMSCDDAFHNRFSSRYIILEIQLRSTKSARYGFHVEVDSYLRADAEALISSYKDLNTVELKRIQRKHAKNKKQMFFPCGFRQATTPQHVPAFEECCSRNGVNSRDFITHYWRPFTDGSTSRPAFGIQSKLNGATDLLI